MSEAEVEFVDESDTGLAPAETSQFSEAVLHSSDWTVETIVSQLTRGNIEMDPRFQRRDAWSVKRKSSFIESLVLGLPVPQIVLAERKGQRGKYIVLDGKQRLLSLLQFTGNAAEDQPHNRFKLSGLDARADLSRKGYDDLKKPALESDLNAFLNYTIRTVVIRNWPTYDFLHVVFLRLNTGSVKLSPQELRQAMFPGEFSNNVDDAAIQSGALRTLLSRDSPDPRMRDVELLVRFLAFHFFLPDYSGRMKDFLDFACEKLNAEWQVKKDRIQEAITIFEEGANFLIELLGGDKVARKEGSRSFNRAIFDALIFYAADAQIRQAMIALPEKVKAAYEEIVNNAEFLEASESDTAGIPHTVQRLSTWGATLRAALGLQFNLPSIVAAESNVPTSRTRVVFEGFWN